MAKAAFGKWCCAVGLGLWLWDGVAGARWLPSYKELDGSPSGFDTLPARVDIPVTWRQTRGRYRAAGPSTQTESFRSVWRLTSDGSGIGWLESARARAQVLRSYDPLTRNLALIIDEQGLVELLGLTYGRWQSSHDQELNPHLIRLSLMGGGDALKFSIGLGEDEHCMIQIQLGQIDWR